MRARARARARVRVRVGFRVRVRVRVTLPGSSQGSVEDPTRRLRAPAQTPSDGGAPGSGEASGSG